MMRFVWILGLFLLLSLGLADSARAGQARSGRGRGGQQGGITVPTLTGSTIEELRAFQAYFYVIGGRDPMIMRMPTDEEMGLEQNQLGRAPTLEEMERFLAEALESIAIAIKERNYVTAIEVGERTMNVVDNEWPPLKADPPHLRRMDEEIRNYHRMAVKLKAREDIQKEFEAMRLRVDGVIWSPIDAKAVVNGRLLSAGEIMLNERKQGDLRVENIEEHGVVFQFKGIRFRIPVEVYSVPGGR